MKILFIHPNMPGQYKHLCRAFADNPKNTVVFITKPRNLEIPNVHKVEYKMQREPSAATHRYLTGVERAVLTGQEVWRMCHALRHKEGFVPDVICAHPGWGDALFVKDIYPESKLLSFFEFYYQFYGADVGFDPSEPAGVDDAARVRTKNITNILSLEAADWGICPTFWQHSVHPKEFQSKITVLHDGIDVDVAKPDPAAEFTVHDNLKFKLGDEVVTYIARNFEPYRGFPTFMRAAAIIQKQRPNCHIIAVGADEVSYGKKLGKGDTWRHRMLKEVPLDMNRLHFTGVVSYANLMKLFQVSAAHIYLTYPFVLSWSAMESMACGAVLISSRTPPVEEVMNDGENALLADFFSPEEVAEKVIYALDHKEKMKDLRIAARKTIVDRYNIKDLMPLHVKLVEDVASGSLPPEAHTTIMERHQMLGGIKEWSWLKK